MEELNNISQASTEYFSQFFNFIILILFFLALGSLLPVRFKIKPEKIDARVFDYFLTALIFMVSFVFIYEINEIWTNIYNILIHSLDSRISRILEENLIKSISIIISVPVLFFYIFKIFKSENLKNFYFSFFKSFILFLIFINFVDMFTDVLELSTIGIEENENYDKNDVFLVRSLTNLSQFLSFLAIFIFIIILEEKNKKLSSSHHETKNHNHIKTK